MNNQSFSLAERLIPATYIQQASASIRARENLVKNLLEQVNADFENLEAPCQSQNALRFYSCK